MAISSEVHYESLERKMKVLILLSLDFGPAVRSAFNDLDYTSKCVEV
jgi:hypothetical protein